MGLEAERAGWWWEAGYFWEVGLIFARSMVYLTVSRFDGNVFFVMAGCSTMGRVG